MGTNLTLSQRLHNALGSQAVENTKARHAYWHAKNYSTEEWTRLWSRREDCSWAHGFGRMRGFEEVWLGNVTQYDGRCCGNYMALYNVFPEIGGQDIRAVTGVAAHTLVTDIIEVAEDGLSARACYLTPGFIHSTLSTSGGRSCLVLWERYGSDFVFENGAWKYLHEQVCPDIRGGSFDTTNWAKEAYDNLNNPRKGGPGGPPGGGKPGGGRPGGPGGPGGPAGPETPAREQSILPDSVRKLASGANPPVTDGPLHASYTPVQPVQDSVPWPEPYRTLDDDNTYTRPVKS